MKAHDRNQSLFSLWVRPILLGVAVGVLCCTLLLLLMALVVQTVDVPRGAALPMAIAAAAVGAFAAGLTAALISRRRGLLLGAVSGLVLFLVVLLAGFARYTAVDGGTAIIKLLVLMAAGGLGGVLGVNRRRR
ncbi:MAG: TIGR04086 family membrane protein [Clostridia bacterium]|nr:TIGR04086 family membrane protein [Clostridia bacterium]